MSNQLSLKYRAKKLSEMVGHKAIIKELEKRSEDLTFPQVMLFSGESGSGKTTLAMMIGQLLQCKEPVKNENGYYECCGECASCKDINKERFERNTYFLDCSSMSKDDVLGLLQRANQSPMYDKNNVFILEEAQELSKQALGATLKLIEKPRANTYFIMTTMNVSKIDKAIQSRSQHYKLKPLAWDSIMDYMAHILEQENLIESVPEEFITEGIPALCEASNGNVRMAVQYLERCLYGEYWTKEQILDELSVVDSATVSQVLVRIMKGEKEALSEIYNLDTNSFFWLGWKNLTDAQVYAKTGYLKNPYQERYLKPLTQHGNLDKMLKTFVDIYECSSFVHENHIISKMIDFLSVPTLTKSERPVRRVRT